MSKTLFNTAVQAAPSKAVIYCRVSDKKQKNDGDGLHSQEHRCRDYAGARGYAVDAVFHDDVTGGGDFMSRPGVAQMLRFLAKSRKDYVVIFDDLKRFARDTEFHIALRKKLAAYNATVECLNFKFEETPEGKFVETVIAAQGGLERLQNRRQTVQKMKARVERGYYVFSVPIGYRYKKREGHGRMLVRDEPVATILTEALEGYASGRFQLQSEVKAFLEAQPEFPKQHGIVLNWKITQMLTRPVYAGMVEAPSWGVSLRKGHHEPLISFETFRKIQDRLNGIARAPYRKDLGLDFPLRGFVTCGDCGASLTACWSKGRAGMHAYYLCFKRTCTSYRKSIRRDAIEGEFSDLVRALQLSEDTAGAARMMFEDMWNHQLEARQDRLRDLKVQKAKLERQVEQFLDRIAEADIASVITAYESRIRKLESDKLQVEEQIENCGGEIGSFDETVMTWTPPALKASDVPD